MYILVNNFFMSKTVMIYISVMLNIYVFVLKRTVSLRDSTLTETVLLST